MGNLLLCILVMVAGACSTPTESVELANVPTGLTSMTIDRVLWSDDARLHEGYLEAQGDRGPFLLGHVVEWQGFPEMKRFTLEADKEFVLEAPGYGSVSARVGTGGVTSNSGDRYVCLYLPRGALGNPARGAEGLDRSIPYNLLPRNDSSKLTWIVTAQIDPLQE